MCRDRESCPDFASIPDAFAVMVQTLGSESMRAQGCAADALGCVAAAGLRAAAAIALHPRAYLALARLLGAHDAEVGEEAGRSGDSPPKYWHLAAAVALAVLARQVPRFPELLREGGPRQRLRARLGGLALSAEVREEMSLGCPVADLFETDEVFQVIEKCLSEPTGEPRAL
ncbi:unnamed protein product [Prorocentrum cordatum]|uniref:Anaphase-promoting complex subunit 1 n=1 Tax=Prorocentrum cordatum TaxID=2364126 RepID=A0ABN9PY26_9DINO|nr:unnamed protein product [Polarella glacialis]